MKNIAAKNIYPNVKLLCKKQKIKIKELENKIGVSAGYFSRIAHAHGEKSIGIDKVISAANILNVTLDELLSEPPIVTNADKFEEIFGEKAIAEAIGSCSWWDEPYCMERGIEG